MSQKNIRVNKSDQFRSLVTETLPYETPLIFDNDNFYRMVRLFGENFDDAPESVKELFSVNEKKSTKPYVYEIVKSSVDKRTLYLAHPKSQLLICRIYEQYHSYILYLCSKSMYSIRYPSKISSSISKNELDGSIDPVIRREQAELAGEDSRNRYVGSYFSYKEFNVLYKFFDSESFYGYEKKFLRLMSIDVSRCFDTIYTHTLSWAVKGKEYTKENIIPNSMSFSDVFDKYIRSGNHDETNGILIGPEYSRIFAEIIFQSIDEQVKRRLENDCVFYDRDYVVKRYIDDIFIFTPNVELEEKVSSYYMEELWEYKLRINPDKVKSYCRPFVTDVTRMKNKIRIEFERLEAMLTKQVVIDERKYRFIKGVTKPVGLARAFIRDIKVHWASDGESHGMSNYVLSMIRKLCSRVLTSQEKDIDCKDAFKKNFSLVVLEVMHYLVSLSPKVSECYKYAHTALLLGEVMEGVDGVDDFKFHLANSLRSLLLNEMKNKYSGNIEKINLLLVYDYLCPEYMLLESQLKSLLFEGGGDYFSIVSAIYLSRKNNEFNYLGMHALEEAKVIVRENDPRRNTESALLLVDLTSCDYISVEDKKDLYKSVFKSRAESHGMRVNEFREFFEEHGGFTHWDGVNLLSCLQRKILRETY